MGKKIAIIGASLGQLPLCLQAKGMGLDVYVFAWDKDAVCKPYADHFVPISITEKEAIAQYCKEQGIQGVASNGSDTTAKVVSYIATKLNLNGVNYDDFILAQDKHYVRQISQEISELTQIREYKYDQETQVSEYPCIVKPINGYAKIGVSLANNEDEFRSAIKYATANNSQIMIEEFAPGKEISVETISFKGQHFIVQTTDKDSSGAPHFVELGHHQPAQLSDVVLNKLHAIIPALLSKLKYNNGPAHIEFKHNGDDVYLIEVNLRGGGDEISNKLVQLSTGHNFLKYIIEVALGDFRGIEEKHSSSCAGIYYLCQQTKQYLPYFEDFNKPSWLVEQHLDNKDLNQSTTNYDRNGYLIYQSDHKIILN